VSSENGPDTLWLILTNAVVGLVTLISIAAIVRAVYLDIKARRADRRSAAKTHADDHAFVIPLLGVTMADGGARLDKRPTPKEKPDDMNTPENGTNVQPMNPPPPQSR